MAYRFSVEEFVNGGLVLRICMVTICVILAPLSAWLYWKSALNRYQVTDAGLAVLKLGTKRLILWEEIDELVWKSVLRCVFIKGKGRTLAFTSTDKFDDLLDLVVEIARRSRCKLSPNMKGVSEALSDDEHPPSAST